MIPWLWWVTTWTTTNSESIIIPHAQKTSKTAEVAPTYKLKFTRKIGNTRNSRASYNRPDALWVGKAENLAMGKTSMQELAEMLPIILSTYPSNINTFHVGSFDILWRKIGSEVLKKGLFPVPGETEWLSVAKSFQFIAFQPWGRSPKYMVDLRSPKYVVDLSKFIDKLLLEL